MRFFLDSALSDALDHWLPTGVISGVTTNPVLYHQADAARVVPPKELANRVAPLPVSVQATGDTRQALYETGCRIADLGGNIVVKVPVVMADGTNNLEVIHRLSSQGIAVNTTACMSANQAMLAAAAGARYVSLLAGRIEDDGGIASEVIHAARSAVPESAEIIIGSIRDPAMVWRSGLAGADIATISPVVLDRMMSNDTARRTVAEFEAADKGGNR